MKLSLTVSFIIVLLVGGTDARIFGKQSHPKPNKQGNKGLVKKQPIQPSADKQKGHYEFDAPSMDNLPAAPILSAPFSLEITDTERKINNVRVTLTGVKEMAALTPAEVLFFEDSFMLAFLEAQSSGTGAEDVHARSLVVFGASTEAQNDQFHGNHKERSLKMRTTSTYFDIFALFEWSCYLCGGSRNDDDYVPAPRPTSPTPRPTLAPKRTAIHTTHTAISVRRNAPPIRASHVADGDDVAEDDGSPFRDFRDRDDDPAGDDDLTDETLSFSGSSPVKEDEESGLGKSLVTDDDAFSIFFGNRQLSNGNDEEGDQFESFLCARLRAGPFPAFHHVGECLAIFSD